MKYTAVINDLYIASFQAHTKAMEAPCTKRTSLTLKLPRVSFFLFNYLDI